MFLDFIFKSIILLGEHNIQSNMLIRVYIREYIPSHLLVQHTLIKSFNKMAWSKYITVIYRYFQKN